MKIQINDLNLTINVCSAIGKIVDGALFNISPSSLTCFCKTSYARIKIESNAIISDEEASFCINDFSKFINYLKLIKTYDEVNAAEMNFNRQSIKYDGNCTSFKFNTCRKEIVEKFIDVELKTEINPICSFSSDSATIKSLIANKSLISDDSTDIIYRIYQDKVKTKMIFADLTDLNNPLSNSIKLTFGLLINGNLQHPFYLNTERLNLATILNSEKIEFHKPDKNILKINLSEENKNFATNIEIYTSLLKEPSC